MEKRNIQISLEEARKWYNSGNSFKRELALKAYSETELSINTYINILALLKDEVIANSKEKAGIYRKLLNIAKYLNSISSIEYNSRICRQNYYVITKKSTLSLFIKYKGFCINKNMYKSDYEIVFNSSNAAKQAINILGDELNILFE